MINAEGTKSAVRGFYKKIKRTSVSRCNKITHLFVFLPIEFNDVQYASPALLPINLSTQGPYLTVTTLTTASMYTDSRDPASKTTGNHPGPAALFQPSNREDMVSCLSYCPWASPGTVQCSPTTSFCLPGKFCSKSLSSQHQQPLNTTASVDPLHTPLANPVTTNHA